MTKLRTIAQFSGFPPGFLFGANMTNGSDAANDINIANGFAKTFDRKYDIVVPAVTRELDALIGTGNGGRLDASISDGTWHVFAFGNGNPTNDNVGFSKLIDPTSAPNWPGTSYSYRRIGSILRAGSIVPFSQNGDRFSRPASNDMPIVTISATAQLITLAVPTGIIVTALIHLGGGWSNGNTIAAEVLPAALPDVIPVVNANPTQVGATSGTYLGFNKEVDTNTSGQIRIRSSSASGGSWWLTTYGWIDTRGRIA